MGKNVKILVIGKEGRLEQYAPKWAQMEDYDISYVPMGSPDDVAIDAGRDADFMLADAMAKVSENLIANMPKLKMIHSEGVGFNFFDIGAARKRHIYVCNCKAANAGAVAEQTLLLMLGLLRDVVNGDAQFRKGGQISTKENYMINGSLRELRECTVGLLGFGDIAQATARMLQAFGARVLYHNRTRRQELESELKVTYVSQNELLSQSDIISIHLNSNEETYHTVNEKFLMSMKKGAYLINTSRGDLVDSEALIGAIESGHIAGAGLDTVSGEPVGLDNPLLTAPDEVKNKIIFSCHIGGITGGAFRRCHEMFWENVKRMERGEMPERVVNLW